MCVATYIGADWLEISHVVLKIGPCSDLCVLCCVVCV